MKKIWIALFVLTSGSTFADSISNVSTGAFYAVPSTASFTASMTPYTGSPVNTGNSQVPFWNNPSEDSLFDGHFANAGDVLAGLATNTNLIGSNLTGTTGTLAGDLATQINGNYYAFTGGSDPINSTTPTTAAGVTAEATTPLAFSFLSNATAYNIALLFADSILDTGAAPSATVLGYYTGSVAGSLSLHPLDGAVAQDTNGTISTLATNDVLASSGSVYGFYATVCYQVTLGTCTASVTYTSGAGNYSTNMSAGNPLLGDLGYNHFVYFQLASGEEVIAFEDFPWALGTPSALEGIGDFNDTMIALTPASASVSAPEPGTMAIIGLGLLALGLNYFGRKGTRC